MRSFFSRFFLTLSVAVVVGLVGAIPLTNATGISRVLPNGTSDGPLIFSCGVILFLLTLALIGPLRRSLSALASRLAQTDARPTPLAAATMIGSGTLCVLSSLYLAWASASNPANQIRDQMQGMMKSVKTNGGSISVNLPPEALVGSGSGSGAMILTVAVFVLGTGLIALGVWASLPAAIPVKVPIPASDATSL